MVIIRLIVDFFSHNFRLGRQQVYWSLFLERALIPFLGSGKTLAILSFSGNTPVQLTDLLLQLVVWLWYVRFFLQSSWKYHQRRGCAWMLLFSALNKRNQRKKHRSFISPFVASDGPFYAGIVTLANGRTYIWVCIGYIPGSWHYWVQLGQIWK